MKKKLISLLLITITSLSACNFDFTNSKNDETTNKIARSNEKILRHFKKAIPENQIFTIGKSETELFFTKSGITDAKTNSNVSAQVSGEVTKIKVKVGDKVNKDDILIELGNSINTDLNEIQYESAKDGLNTAIKSEKLNNNSSKTSIESAEIGTKIANNVYKSSIESKKNARDLFEEQLKNAEKSLEDAEKAYKEIKESYYNSKDTLNEAKERGDQQIAILDQQVAELKAAKENAKKGIEQAKSGITQMQIAHDNQENQLDLGINNSFSQYQSSLKQLDAVRNGIKQQELLTESQISQAKSAVDMAKLSKDYSKIKSPIMGTITAININEGNMAAPGQPLISIQTNESIIIKTSINEEESKLIKKNSQVKIETNDKIITGKINYINSSLNPVSKKVDVEIETFDTANISPGSIITIQFPITGKNIFIPMNSVHIEDEKKYVKSYNYKNEIIFIEVELGEIIGDYIEIKKGLRGDENILKATTTFLSRGDLIKIETS